MKETLLSTEGQDQGFIGALLRRFSPSLHMILALVECMTLVLICVVGLGSIPLMCS